MLMAKCHQNLRCTLDERRGCIPPLGKVLVDAQDVDVNVNLGGVLLDVVRFVVHQYLT